MGRWWLRRRLRRCPDNAYADRYDDGYGPAVGQPAGRREKRAARVRAQADAREARWQGNRLAVPYRTDGPRITFGVLWIVCIVVAITNNPILVTIVASAVAGLAGLQAGFAWFPSIPQTKWWTGLAALVVGAGGFLGLIGVAAGLGLGVAVLLVYLIANPVHRRSTAELLDVLVRCAIPPGLAAGSMAALAEFEVGAALALVALISAYEVGDFLIGSGSSNAIEGPISGLLALGAVLFLLWIAAPTPFTPRSVLLFGALAGVCSPMGQIMASGLLPRGADWAPALRRLDSYLLAAPLWLVLLVSAPTSTAL